MMLSDRSLWIFIRQGLWRSGAYRLGSVRGHIGGTGGGRDPLARQGTHHRHTPRSRVNEHPWLGYGRTLATEACWMCEHTSPMAKMPLTVVSWCSSTLILTATPWPSSFSPWHRGEPSASVCDVLVHRYTSYGTLGVMSP
jgi:hypothetical protein